jgi:uncharacterized membrane protein YhhN
VAVADGGLAAAGARRARWLTKPAVVPAIALAARSGGGRPPRGLDAAQAGSWVGDVALLSRSDAGLLGGVAGFAAAHLAYLAEIRRCAHPPAGVGRPAGRGPERAVTVAYGSALVVAGTVLWHRLDTPTERRLRVPVLGYAALVAGMGAAATRAGLRRGGPAGRALAVGGAAFVASDGLVALSRFGDRRRPAVEAAGMVTYAAAQALLARALTDPVS